MEFFQSLYLNLRFYFILGTNAAIFILAYFFPFLIDIAKLGVLLLGVIVIIDLLLLYRTSKGIEARRETPERFSNGDQNDVSLHISNHYPFQITFTIIDELPHQFQIRNSKFQLQIKENGEKTISYPLRPVKRGVYQFGTLNIYVASPLSLLRRRYQFAQDEEVPTYPSYIQMRKYQIMAISNRLTEVGVKKNRRLGHTSEFEQIKEYVRGDDYRTVNWKATARAGKLMVNQYMDERAQNVYCLIDKSRTMKMPFEGMSLLDYAINASLVISNIAIHKKDKAGLITFSEKIDASVAADYKPTQMNLIMEVLYKQKTKFLEADYGRLYTFIKNKISQRSLLILFTNFESLQAMRRQLPYLQRITKQHLLMVVFFENTELHSLTESSPKTTEDIYVKTIAQNFVYEKEQISKELQQQGIISILCPPEQLTVNTINKYLELKSRGMI